MDRNQNQLGSCRLRLEGCDDSNYPICYQCYSHCSAEQELNAKIDFNSILLALSDNNRSKYRGPYCHTRRCWVPMLFPTLESTQCRQCISYGASREEDRMCQEAECSAANNDSTRLPLDIPEFYKGVEDHFIKGLKMMQQIRVDFLDRLTEEVASGDNAGQPPSQ